MGRGDRPGGGLERGTLDVAGMRRSYWLARAPAEDGERPGGLERPLDATGILLDMVNSRWPVYQVARCRHPS